MPSRGRGVPAMRERPEVERVGARSAGSRVATTSSSRPQRRSAATPGAWIDVGRDGVARERRPVDHQHPVALAGQQHRGRRAGAPGARRRWRRTALRHGSSSRVVRRRARRSRDPGGRRSVAGSPMSPAPAPGGVGGGLGPAAQAELGQDVADVVLDGLAADEEAVGDLRVRQAVAEQVEHLGLALGQHARRPARRCVGRGRRASAARPPRRRRRGPPGAARTRRARRGPRPWRPRAGRRASASASSSRARASSIGICARANPASASRRQACGSPVPVARHDPPSRQRGRAPEVVAAGWRGTQRSSGWRPRRRRRRSVAGGEVDVDEQRQQRRRGRARRVDLGRAPARGRRRRAPVSPRARWIAATERAASRQPSRSTPASSCSASSKRPWRTRRSASRTSAPPRRPTAGRAPTGGPLR